MLSVTIVCFLILRLGNRKEIEEEQGNKQDEEREKKGDEKEKKNPPKNSFTFLWAKSIKLFF